MKVFIARSLLIVTVLLSTAVVGIALYAASRIDAGDQRVATDGVTVAFIADQGYGANAQAVLRLIRDEGADLVIHSGDFDYASNPTLWDEQINSVLGRDFPYLASVGNHDVAAWEGYARVLADRLARTPEVRCTGEIGINQTCVMSNVGVVLSGIGTLGNGHLAYLEDALASLSTPWRICSWHKNQHLMQLGEKGDEVGWEAYDACREAGALITTGHEHSYSRTHLMADFSRQVVASTSSTLPLMRGRTVAFVSGMGGHSIRSVAEDADNNPWWAATSTRDTHAAYGALLCWFPTTEDEPARCAFKNIDGVTVDTFSLTSQP